VLQCSRSSGTDTYIHTHISEGYFYVVGGEFLDARCGQEPHCLAQPFTRVSCSEAHGVVKAVRIHSEVFRINIHCKRHDARQCRRWDGSGILQVPGTICAWSNTALSRSMSPSSNYWNSVVCRDHPLAMPTRAVFLAAVLGWLHMFSTQ
jgi:hypothetical protein